MKAVFQTKIFSWSSLYNLLVLNTVKVNIGSGSATYFEKKCHLFTVACCRRAKRHYLSQCWLRSTVYPKKHAHGFVVLCFAVVTQSFIMNSHEVFIHIHQGCFAGTGAIVRLPQCQWSKPDGYGKISQCITTTKHSKAKTVCIFLGIYCMSPCGVTRPWWIMVGFCIYASNNCLFDTPVWMVSANKKDFFTLKI